MEQKPGSEEAASIQVLGISLEDLGVGIARTWGFPSMIVSTPRNQAVLAIKQSS